MNSSPECRVRPSSEHDDLCADGRPAQMYPIWRTHSSLPSKFNLPPYFFISFLKRLSPMISCRATFPASVRGLIPSTRTASSFSFVSSLIDVKVPANGPPLYIQII